MSTIDNFLGNFSIGARSNLYEVNITGDGISGFDKLAFLCKTAQVPGRTVGPIEVKYLNHTIKVPGDAVYDDYSITVLHDEDHEVRNGLDEWQQVIIENIESKGASEVSQFYKEVQIQQLKRDGSKNPVIYKLMNAWPTAVEPMDLGFDNSDTILEFGVTFSYSHWVKG